VIDADPNDEHVDEETVYDGPPDDLPRAAGDTQDDLVESEDGVSEDQSSAVKR
jgi:hypothetical protein